MLDVSYFQNSNNNVQLFQTSGQWSTWIKPRSAKIVNFLIIGSGAGGGGGLQSAGTRSGGASGGSGSFIKATYFANLLPDVLYIYCGRGGAGGSGGTVPTSGSSGESSFVTIIPDTTNLSNIILRSGTTPATGGGAGSTVASTAGVGESISTTSNSLFLNLGTFQTNSVIGGIAGGTANSANQSSTGFLMGGSGGGGTGTGGGLTSPGIYPLIAATPINTNGLPGFVIYEPFGLIGGRGGGGGTTGGNGGFGAPGTGGGGGGAGSTSAGNGGRGGDGFVLITTNF